jgi:hypothetical protein
MKRSPREQLIYFVSILLAAAPFAFGLIRAFSTGSDFRYLWLAIAAFLGATAVMAGGKARSRKPSALFALWAVALVIATLLAGTVAALLGNRAPVVWLVAFFFGFCCSAGSALYALSRARTI